MRRDVRFFNGAGIEGLKVIEQGTRVPVLEEPVNEMAADETCPAGHEQSHAAPPIAARAPIIPIGATAGLPMEM
jgi:hypothetical protein